MKLQTKITILLSIVLGILVASFLSFQYIQINEKKLISKENKKNQELVIDKVLQINKTRFDQLLNDNSGWDDMVNFIANPDLEWAKDNVNFFVNSFKLSFVLVYDPAKKLIYQFGDSVCLNHLKYPDQSLIDNKLTSTPFVHYFQHCGTELIEMFGATVVPSSDADNRATTPKGYLFIGKKWDKSYLLDHRDATGYNVEMADSTEFRNYRISADKIYFFRSIADETGKTVDTLIFSKDDDLQDSLKQLFYLSIIFVLTSVAAILLFLFYFRKIILVPINKVSDALEKKNPSKIESLKSRDDEFKLLADLIQEFFYQQNALKRNNEILEETNATKDRLFSIIAHDLKNPVGGMVSLSELLNEYVKSKDFETLEEVSGLISRQTKDAMSLLNTLFDWARSQTGQIAFSPQLIDLAPIVNEVAEIAEHTASLKGITILPSETNNIKVFADANMLKTVIRNLVNNAIKFTYSGGTIIINAAANSKDVEISVIDTGIGMDLETQNKLFRINKNFSTRGTANENGNGLGLIICKEFTEKHGGQIRVISSPGSGSQFIISLPYEL